VASILVIGGTGYAGSHIVDEAVSRGHDVTLVSRNEPAEKVDGVTYLTGDLTEQVPDLTGADVVVAALSPRGSNEGTLRGAYGSLAKAAAAAGARFVAIGGFSSLRPAEGAPRFAEAGEIPAEFAAEATEMNAILGDLLASDDAGEWVCVRPAAEFGAHAPGEKLDRYRTSHEVAIFDAEGTSAIGGADFAAAVVDEIEKPTLQRGQISFAY
jgi:putative NADH-flavin reductase